MTMTLKVSFIVLLCAVGCMCQELNSSAKCVDDGGFCENHNECCSGTCVTFTFKCAPNANYYRQSSLDRSALQTLINGLFASTERPANYSLPTPGLNSRFGEDEATAPPAQSPPPASAVNPDCKEIGEKCYRDSECCTNRCHGFLHQCVT
ncbi:unnamed protein product [Hermetia illucens]|uniref:Uncharacterized protein n=1 Tax=Hermetia illucens TaxID=343691 RepID=A0A7R8UZN4_HERIL|nr:uncharacterized protein LOC119658013 isoform X1 [Hermetia illucens]CAD7089992.1 unnamed protein product [Hermetia illucens]